MTQAPLSWVQEIHHALIEAKEIPLHGLSPVFPWEACSQQIASALQLPELKIIPGQTQFLTDDKITEGLGEDFISIPLEMAPLSGKAFWIMAKADIAKWTALNLTPANGTKGFSSPQFQEGFYYFLAVKVLAAIRELNPFGDLSPQMGKTAELPKEQALCIDVEIQHPKQTLWGRIVCPLEFHQAFKAHFSQRTPTPLTSALAKQIDVPIRVEIGQSVLSLSKWKNASVGDFILLDRCTFHPQTHKGTATLSLYQTPLLRARVKETHLKIVDYAFYREEKKLMSPETPSNEENREETFEEGEILSSEESSEVDAEENHLWSAENPEAVSEKIISASEIPMTLTVEVARMRMNLDKLLQVSPGNVLELPVKPEQGVDLTVDGKIVAKGELIKLGEMLGVKILQIGQL